MAPLGRLWPRSLAARLALLLLLALGAAQIGLIGVFRLREDSVVEAVGHSQALNQTVTLARLLSIYPTADSTRLASAFGSRQTCASISSDPPPARAMSPAEAALAEMIQRMLHGVNIGPPQAAIVSSAPHAAGCADDGLFARGHDGAGDSAAPSDEGLPLYTTVSVSAPLADGRWLTTRTGVEAPGGWNRTTLISFLVSSLAVAAAAVLSVRAQTRSLRALAEASERLGRGESVAPLATRGPSEVAAASRAFNTMQDRLGAYLRDRLRLLASISHDLRTPLTTLRLKAEFIEDAGVRDGIVATIDELTTICESSFAFSRAEATTEATQNVDLTALVRDIAWEFTAVDKRVVAAPSPALVYPCRPVAIKRALRNLIENAVRYGGGARVRVENRRDGVAILVEDDGPGLPAEQVEDAFQPFVRLEPSRSAETGGLGLGLAIARSIVKAHGGTLTLANRPEGGLRAEIALPRGAAV
jgi:signal transduction histidine kinase